MFSARFRPLQLSMTSSTATLDEEARLAVLDSYGILDTPPERSFDDVVRLVSQLLSAPIAAVNLIARVPRPISDLNHWRPRARCRWTIRSAASRCSRSSS